MNQKVGFIGLGAMGHGMATNLCGAGLLTTVWNRSLAPAQAFSSQCLLASDEKQVINVADSASSLAQECNVILLCVSADDDVREVVASMQPHLSAGTIIIDTSTISANTVKDIASQLLVQGVHYLDAPVSGGVEGAANGQLVMMVGGDKDALDSVLPILASVSKKVSHLGISGSGQAAKAVNQIMAAGIAQAVTEALAFGEAMKLPMPELIDVIAGGAAGNWFLSKRGKSMVNGDFIPGFKMALHLKDLNLCRDMAEQVSGHDMRLPIIEMTRLHYQRLIDQGYADEDISGLYRLKKQLFNGEL